SRLAADISAAPETDSDFLHDDDAHRRLAEGAELVRDAAGTSAARASEPNLSDAFVADGGIADALAATAPAREPEQTALTPDADPLDIGPAVTETTTETGGDDARLAAIASALSAEQIDVFLEPIKLLDNVGAPHFEVTLRLRLDDGTELDRDGYGEATHGTPLLPLIDTLAAAKTRSAAWKLMQRDKVGRVFTSVSGGSLGSDQFSDDMSAIFSGERETAERMVLSFPQSDARALTKRDRETLAQLKRAGFAFAIDHVTDLETDFSDLNDCGFAFVKLDAEIFLDGLQVGMTRVPSDDICRHLGSLGLTPIVGHVRDVTQLQKLRTCGVRLAQGPLLGAPRALKSDWFGAGA
ncbi:MAG: EAL domain-containing protein, partial [Pseudomonadota bacterium]